MVQSLFDDASRKRDAKIVGCARRDFQAARDKPKLTIVGLGENAVLASVNRLFKEIRFSKKYNCLLYTSPSPRDS